jgi:hypothetical protein
MKPEICKEWEDALSHLRNAEKLKEDGKFQEAEEEANVAIVCGIHAIRPLAKELNLPSLSAIQENAFYEWQERKFPEFGAKHYTPEENVEWVGKTLRRLSGELPPDTLRPLQ